uniref:NADH-ubiquinone oxidoreductase chain 3 n=1 Tax=Culicoides wadai TaxID=469754 RepID=A8B0S3_9DIPT|nr:NADH dehydrogenase subunit 3 [Culicoides wadai]
MILMMTLLLTILILLSNVIMLMALVISKKMFYDREKMSPFECGFEPFNSSRMPFSLRFFLIAIIFLIFDVEIALLLPSIFSLKLNYLLNWSLTILTIILILIIGLFNEWKEGALEWSN